MELNYRTGPEPIVDPHAPTMVVVFQITSHWPFEEPVVIDYYDMGIHILPSGLGCAVMSEPYAVERVLDYLHDPRHRDPVLATCEATFITMRPASVVDGQWEATL